MRPGLELPRAALLRRLVDIYYRRDDDAFTPGTFRVRGDVVDVHPAYLEGLGYRIAFWGDEIERLSLFDPAGGQEKQSRDLLTIYPARISNSPTRAAT